MNITSFLFRLVVINLVLVEQLEQPRFSVWLDYPVTTRPSPRKRNMAITNRLFEDVFPIEHEVFHCHVSFRECMFCWFTFFKTISKSIESVSGNFPSQKITLRSPFFPRTKDHRHSTAFVEQVRRGAWQGTPS